MTAGYYTFEGPSSPVTLASDFQFPPFPLASPVSDPACSGDPLGPLLPAAEAEEEDQGEQELVEYAWVIVRHRKRVDCCIEYFQ